MELERIGTKWNKALQNKLSWNGIENESLYLLIVLRSQQKEARDAFNYYLFASGVMNQRRRIKEGEIG